MSADLVAGVQPPRPVSSGIRRRQVRRFFRHKSALVGVALVTLIVVPVIFGNFIAPYGANSQDLNHALAPPLFAGGTAAHLLGTDQLGRDIFSRLLIGGRVSLVVAVSALLIQTLLGTSLGVIAGYVGGWLDQLIMRIADVQLALPGLVAMLAVVAIFGPSEGKLILFLGISGWPVYARIVRSQVLSLREQEFIEAARALGAPQRRIMGRHILPNIVASIVVVGTVTIPYVILTEATLSFLGLGVPPEIPTWGSMVNDGQPYLSTAWWVSTIPGVAILLLVLGVNLLGDGLRDALDPRAATASITDWKTPVEPEPDGDLNGGRRHAPAALGRRPRSGAPGHLLEVRNLDVQFVVDNGRTHAVNDVSFFLDRGEVMGLVGESGCGKSTTALALMRLLSATTTRIRGEANLGGTDLLRLPEAAMRQVRTGRIGIVFQDPMTSLNPVLTIGHQLVQPLRLHMKMTRRQARARAEELLEQVGIPGAARRLREYPHQLSGGMRQRVVIAMALSCDPDVLIADEPTTALDVTTQAEIMDLLARLQATSSLAVILISHNLGLVASIADRISVMYAGRIVESGPALEVLSKPRHPYTSALLESMPRIGAQKSSLAVIEGMPPDLSILSSGCSFAPRCPYADNICQEALPALAELTPRRSVACVRPLVTAGGDG